MRPQNTSRCLANYFKAFDYKLHKLGDTEFRLKHTGVVARRSMSRIPCARHGPSFLANRSRDGEEDWVMIFLAAFLELRFFFSKLEKKKAEKNMTNYTLTYGECSHHNSKSALDQTKV